MRAFQAWKMAGVPGWEQQHAESWLQPVYEGDSWEAKTRGCVSLLPLLFQALQGIA